MNIWLRLQVYHVTENPFTVGKQNKLKKSTFKNLEIMTECHSVGK